MTTAPFTMSRDTRSRCPGTRHLRHRHVISAIVIVALLVRRRRRFRRLPATINGIRIECQGAVLDEDLVVERNWRATLLMTNVTRKPVSVPVLGSRAVVTSGRKQYAGAVYLEREAREINPGDGLVAWVLVRLDSGGVPRRVEVELNSSMRVSATLSASTGKHRGGVTWAGVDGVFPTTDQKVGSSSLLARVALSAFEL